MVNFGAGQVCGECIQNNMGAVEEGLRKAAEKRRAGEYRHPEYRGYEVVQVAPQKEKLPVGAKHLDSKGRVWIRVA